VTALFAAGVAFPALALQAQEAAAGGVQGVVRALDNGELVRGAEILVDDVPVDTTDDQGRFAVDGVTPGSRRLAIRAVGFVASGRTLTIEAGRTVRLDLGLTRMVVELEPIDVEGIRIPPRRAQEVLDRMRRGLGTFLLRRDIDKIGVTETSSALASTGKVKLNVTSQGGRPVAQALMGRGARRCRPAIFLNGTPFQLYNDALDDAIPLEDIELIEIYEEFEAPGEFNVSGTGCGAIVFWMP